jgi:hypothetical protein
MKKCDNCGQKFSHGEVKDVVLEFNYNGQACRDSDFIPKGKKFCCLLCAVAALTKGLKALAKKERI